MIKKFTLAKANAEATIDILKPEHIAQVLALQDETRSALPAAQKMFVIPQKPNYFQSLLSREKGLMIGVRVKAQLIAQMAVMGPLPLKTALEINAITRNEIQLHHADPNDSVTIAKSMTVHPNWRGNELSAALLEAALSLPMVQAEDHVFAQISADNIRSWALFLRNGFGIVAAAIDPGDNKARFIVQKPAAGFSLQNGVQADDMDYAADFAAIVRLTQKETLVGQLDEGVAYKLAFYPSAEKASSWVKKSRSSTRQG